ncbi:MAG: hypothetical protein IT473_15330 [Lysobacter sp.]|nr:hypothetical protein [Lysobacter sp.]
MAKGRRTRPALARWRFSRAFFNIRSGFRVMTMAGWVEEGAHSARGDSRRQCAAIGMLRLLSRNGADDLSASQRTQTDDDSHTGRREPHAPQHGTRHDGQDISAVVELDTTFAAGCERFDDTTAIRSVTIIGRCGSHSQPRGPFVRVVPEIAPAGRLEEIERLLARDPASRRQWIAA